MLWWILGSIYLVTNLGFLAYYAYDEGFDGENWHLILWAPFFLLPFVLIVGLFFVISGACDHIYTFIIEKFQKKQGVRLYKEAKDFLEKESPQPNNTTVRLTTFK